MMLMGGRLWPLAVFAMTGASLCCAQTSSLSSAPATTLSAREIFYVAEDVTKPAAQGTGNGTGSKVRPSGSRAANHTPRPASSGGQASPPPDSATGGEMASANSVSSGRVRFEAVMDRRYPPLGLRYTVERIGDEGKQAVASDTVFHSNDHIQFTVSVSAPGYLYVLSRGASGVWSTLFPESNAAPESNLVQPRKTYTFPPGGRITFTDPAGEERVFLFLSRQPVRNTEELMLQLSGKGAGTVTAPPATTDEAPHATELEAMNRMDDSRVNLLRASYSRDLIVEKVDAGVGSGEQAAVPQAPAADTSVYVVNPSAGANAHVVADVQFKHE